MVRSTLLRRQAQRLDVVLVIVMGRSGGRNTEIAETTEPIGVRYPACPVCCSSALPYRSSERYSEFFQTILVRDLMLCTVLLDLEDFFTCRHKLFLWMLVGDSSDARRRLIGGLPEE
jgi:hypothetical protein